MADNPIAEETVSEGGGFQQTPVKEVNPRLNQSIQEMEAAVRELLERQTREAAIASEGIKRAEAIVARQQTLLEEDEKRERELKEKLQYKPSFIDDDDRTGESRPRTWKPSILIGNPPTKENNKHPFSATILAEELPKKFKYPVDIEAYDRMSDPKHHLDVFDNRMVLLNASDAIKCKAFTITLKKAFPSCLKVF
ncbi:hypothetical protein PIB30_073440 [Stylosanthes scabra]|uniref:Uncharacterized protein n=1 Tax=Stylosanthes scabra TaxID=79078 RepID=A0ABU6VMV0_9FABA|nr:hypothetical protein [Stylosanthes scabra]